MLKYLFLASLFTMPSSLSAISVTNSTNDVIITSLTLTAQVKHFYESIFYEFKPPVGYTGKNGQYFDIPVRGLVQGVEEQLSKNESVSIPIMLVILTPTSSQNLLCGSYSITKDMSPDALEQSGLEVHYADLAKPHSSKPSGDLSCVITGVSRKNNFIQ